MKRVEIRLSLEAVLPLIAVIREAADSLSDDLAAPNSLGDIEADLREGWREDLVSALGAHHDGLEHRVGGKLRVQHDRAPIELHGEHVAW